MKRPRAHAGTVKAGAVVFDSPASWRSGLAKLEGKRVRVTVEVERHLRSLSQNAYWWSVVIPLLCETTGYTADEMHEAMKWKFLRSRGDGPLPTVRGTSDLNTAEFEELARHVREWASADLGCYIPEPNESMEAVL